MELFYFLIGKKKVVKLKTFIQLTKPLDNLGVTSDSIASPPWPMRRDLSDHLIGKFKCPP